MADAEQLAATVQLGEHGRRRHGMGDEFWQYRTAVAGDPARSIDWRRSARSDAHFVQEKEWQAAQSVLLWPDHAQSMDFSSDKSLPTKLERANILTLAIAILLIRSGERVTVGQLATPPKSGETQLTRIALALAETDTGPDYGTPELRNLVPNSRAVFASDFMGSFDAISDQVTRAADQGIKGLILQILDPQEEAFPFDGRTVFESIGKTISHETLKASDLRDRYLQRLTERKAALADLALNTGWQYHCHRTDDSAQSALLWAYHALERRT